MRMRKPLTLFASALIAISLVACDANPVQKDLPKDTNEAVSNEDTVKEESQEDETAIKADFLNYTSKELKTIAPLEKEVIDSYAGVSGENYTDDTTMHKTLKSIAIPTSKLLIDKAEAIVPETKVVTDAHKTYLSAINNQHSAFTMLLTALETQDADLVAEANEKLALARKEMDDYIVAVNDLAIKYDINIAIATEDKEKPLKEDPPKNPDKKGTAREDLSPLQIDMMNYVTLELKKTNQFARGVDEAYNGVIGDNYTDDTTMHQVIKTTVIPTSEKLIETAESIVPKTKEVQDIHDIYLTAMKTKHSAYTMMAKALETQNSELIEPANELIDLSITQMNDFDTALTELGNKHDVRFD